MKKNVYKNLSISFFHMFQITLNTIGCYYRDCANLFLENESALHCYVIQLLFFLFLFVYYTNSLIGQFNEDRHLSHKFAYQNEASDYI